MKKIDNLIIRAFIGPFILTLVVVVFILLVQLMMQYIDDLLGKGLSYLVFARLLFYFSLQLVPLSLPLAILLSSLITFGNLGEHFELTAMKGGGVSLVRVLRPIFIFTSLIAIGSFWFSDQIVPKTNLKAYSLLWDIKQKSPALSIREGLFYNGLPGFSIKVNKKYEGGRLKDIMIYDHSANRGNQELILADSGRMYTFHQDRYLALELFHGNSYHDNLNTTQGKYNRDTQAFVRTSFDKSQIIFSLASFDMDTTDQKLFSGHRVMKNYQRLRTDIDSLQQTKDKNIEGNFRMIGARYHFHLQDRLRPDTLKNGSKKKAGNAQEKLQNPGKIIQAKNPSGDTAKKKKPRLLPSLLYTKPSQKQIMAYALTQARQFKNQSETRNTQIATLTKQVNEHFVELYKKFTLAFACITMFCIGAPLGAIIKKGGLGIPVLFSIIFFIIFYIMTITGEKWVKQAYVTPVYGMWGANAILLVVGMFFLRQAKNDSRLFEADVYYVYKERLFERFKKKRA